MLMIMVAACSSSGNKANTDSAAVALQEAPAETSATEDYNISDGRIIPANGLPMIIDFSAEWCPPCKQLKPIFADLKKEYAGKVDFVTINVDSMPLLAQKYNVESIPNLVFVSADGTEVYRSLGFHEASDIKADIAKYLN